MRRVVRRFAGIILVAVLAVHVAFATRAQEPAAPQVPMPVPRLLYTLRMPEPSNHLFEITVSARGVGAEPVEFQMPAWSPGRYVIYDFARNVQDVAASDAAGLPLRVAKTDKQTWRVDAGPGGDVVFSYRVYANNLSGTFSQLNDRHASVNGPSVYMSLVGHKPDPVRLVIEPPSGWKTLNARSRTPGQTTFDFENYDLLLDSPTAIAPNLQIRTFHVDGVEYRVVVQQFGSRTGSIDRYVADVERIVTAENAVLGPPPELDRYTFFVYFAPGNDSTDGMEHLSSTSIVRNHPLDAGDVYNGVLWVTAHEFFHLWNVKRIRPVELGPWDYTRENYTTSLWIAEGITSYYSDLFLRRAGLASDEDYFDALAEIVAKHENAPGRAHTSAEQASFDTWLYFATFPRQRTNAAKVSLDYYNKGAVLGLLLDLEIRGRTGGRRSLDDVFRLMWSRFFIGETASTYYYKGKGYAGADFLAAVNEVAGEDFGPWFAKYVSGTEALDYDTAFAAVGLELDRERRYESFEGGVRLDGENGRIRVRALEEDGAASAAGLRREDVIVRIGDSVATMTAARELFGKGSVEPVRIRVLRDGDAVNLTVPAPQSIFRCSLRRKAGSSDIIVARRRSWLDGR